MKPLSLGTGPGEVAARPEEVVALRRLSLSSDDRDGPSDSFDDDDEGWQSMPTRGASSLVVDGGRNAWGIVLAVWLVDFMTSGM
jgi:hypothetical protein